MRNLTRIRISRFRKTVAAGLVPLLLLTVLPGCVARHLPDWSRVQAVSPETETEVQLYKDSAPNGERKVKGHFLSATDDSVTLKLKDGQIETFQRKRVRKVLAQRAFGKRWPGWLALGISLGVGVGFKDGDFTDSGKVVIGAIIPLAIAIPFFLGSKMGGIYEVPPNHRDWYPQGTSSPPAKGETPKTGEGNIK